MFEKITEFEQQVAEFYGAPYAVATDCCTHAIELCLRLYPSVHVTIPEHTYISVPMTMLKLNQSWAWKAEPWKDFYYLGNTNIIDAAVYWKRNGYVPGTFMCLSFQFKKHLSTGKGGMILTDNQEHAQLLQRMSYDGRGRDRAWSEQQISELGYHYYMTPETAELGLSRLAQAQNTEPRSWSYQDYPHLPNMPVFNKQ